MATSPDLGERWPPDLARQAFDTWRERAAQLARDHSWPDVLRLIVEDVIRERHAAAAHRNFAIASAAISMLVHLRPSDDGSKAQLTNDRRRRTRYGSYPTPPDVAEAIADHIALHLGEGPATILDPTIEGAPLLLACARGLADRAVRLVGIDREPAAVAACEQLFASACRARPGEYLKPSLICGDAFNVVADMAPVDALVNNPPWGERDRNGRERFPGGVDPFQHFVELGLDRLREGAPFGFVLPGQAATAPRASGLRERLLDSCTLDAVITLPVRSFPRATVRTLLVLGRKGRGETRDVRIVRYPRQPISEPTRSPETTMVPQGKLAGRGEAWLVCGGVEPPLRRSTETIALGDIAEVLSGIVPYARGRGNPSQSSEIVARKPYTFPVPAAQTCPVLRGRQVRPFYCLEALEHVRLGRHLAHVGRHPETLDAARVFVRELCGRDGALVAAVAPVGSLPRYGIFSIVLRDERLDPHALAVLLNSGSVARHIRASGDGMLKESFNRIRGDDLRRLPIPRALLEGPTRAQFSALGRAAASDAGTGVRVEIDLLVERVYES